MNSVTDKRNEEARRQANLRREIARLQAQLNDPAAPAQEPPRTPPKRRRPPGNILAPSTPSPKKRKLTPKPPRESVQATARRIPHLQRGNVVKATPATVPRPSASAPSNVITKLAALSSKPDEGASNHVTRSSAFSERPAPQDLIEAGGPSASRRADDLTLIEGLELGPAEHKPPFDDPLFERLEPSSGIRLLSREIPHQDFQDHLRGRYYLSPSKLYSVIRLLPNKQGYDVPVEGDWVTIAVVAERGPVKHTRAPVDARREDEAQENDRKALDKLSRDIDGSAKPQQPRPPHWKGKAKAEPKPIGKKYVSLKLVDFGCRSQGLSATGRQAVIRGDALLSLLLFESDAIDEIVRDDGSKGKVYRGGSRGAFERMSKLKEGAVVALLNPKILRPFQKSGEQPHPTDNILAITPESIDSVAVIGRARDLGMCNAIRKDGKTCGSWCDKRVSDICDYHIQHAVERKRAGRAEFSVGTSGMSAAAAKRKPAYDPARQWGLKPSEESSSVGATYVVSGHVVTGTNDAKSLYIGESIGRDAQARAARKISARDTDKTLRELLKRDKEGMKAVVRAREYGQQIKNKDNETQDTSKKIMPSKEQTKLHDIISKGEEETATRGASRNVYNAELIKQLGFDPTAKDGRKTNDPEVESKLEALAAIQSSRKKILLGPRPGKKSTSVHAPTPAPKDVLHDQDVSYGSDSEDELDKAEISAFGKIIGFQHQIASNDDSELEVEPPDKSC